MAIGCGPKIAKCILILFNLLFWLSGLILILVASVYLSNGIMKSIDDISKSSINKNTLIGFLIIGIIIFVIAFCGCCGAIKESKFLLGIYILLLLLIIFAQIAIGIFAFISRKSVEDNVKKEFKNQFMKVYGTDKIVTDGIDKLQESLPCCGLDSFNDWEESEWRKNSTQRFPNSCCNPTTSQCWLQGQGNVTIPIGCQIKLTEYLQRFFPIITGVVLGVAFFEIFVVICAFCLCRNTGTLSQEV